MAKETRVCGPEVFFSYDQASYWMEKYLEEFDSAFWDIKEAEIRWMPSGGWRAGVSFTRIEFDLDFREVVTSQEGLFGAEQDA